MEIDKKIIIKLVQALEDLKKSLKGIDIQTKNNVDEEEIDLSDKIIIKSPIVGTAYLAPEPGGKKFVEVGKKIKKGDTVMIIEAMKTMNPIESNLQGKLVKVLVENEQAVEFGQPLMLIE